MRLVEDRQALFLSHKVYEKGVGYKQYAPFPGTILDKYPRSSSALDWMFPNAYVDRGGLSAVT